MYRARVVVPCYNEERRLDAAALLEFAAAHPDIAFTLVDDGSTDATWALLFRIPISGPKSTVIR